MGLRLGESMGKERVRIVLDFSVPLLLLLLVTLLFRFSDLDMTIQAYFYSPHYEGGFNQYAQPWYFLYEYGGLPTVCVGVVSALLLLASFFWRRVRGSRRAALFTLLLLLVGPCLVANLIFKSHWGRPRPRHLLVFNPESSSPKTSMVFAPVGVAGGAGSNSSFPSGHASAAFFLIFPFFLLRRRRPAMAWLALAGGIVYGGVVGLGRIVQGGHFATDVIWALAFVYFSGLVLYYLMGLDKERAG